MYNMYMHMGGIVLIISLSGKVYELEFNAFILVGTVLVEIPARKAV